MPSTTHRLLPVAPAVLLSVLLAVMVLPGVVFGDNTTCDHSIVTIPGLGALQGTTLMGGGDVELRAFYGVPYAKPPVDTLRWAAPEDPLPWEGTRSAESFGATCAGSGCTNATTRENESEDCLFLNIFTPSGKVPPPLAPPLLPVLVYIHGGAYSSGCGDLYAVHNIAAASIKAGKPILTVSLNYRLNFFGFLASESMRKEGEAVGNYGLLDQRKALEFVNKYISLFGGDPHDVTIQGESAGAGCVASHLTMEKSYSTLYTNGRLFHRAIGESGLGAMWNAKPMSEAEKVFKNITTELLCERASDVMECLRDRSVGEFMDLLPFFPGISFEKYIPFSPVVDGVEVLATPFTLFDQGKHAHLPLIGGSLRDEYSYFLTNTTHLPKDADQSDFDALLLPLLPANSSDAYLSRLHTAYSAAEYQYPADLREYSQWWWAGMRAFSDHEFSCPSRRVIRNMGKQKNFPVYTYFLTHPTASGTWVGDSGEDAFLVPHVSDLPYVFNCTSTNFTECSFNVSSEATLASRWSTWWGGFAADAVLPAPWEVYREMEDNMLSLSTEDDGGLTMLYSFRANACEIWDEVMDLTG